MEEVGDLPPLPPQSSPESSSVKIELGSDARAQPSPHHPSDQSTIRPLSQPETQNHPHQMYPEWLALVMGFCFTAIAMGLQCQDSSHTSISLHGARLCLVVALAAFVVSKYIHPNLGAQAQVLEYAGVFCGVTAFFLAITVTFPLCLKLISWTVYVVSFISILFSWIFC